MIITSNNVWLDEQFVPASIEVENGKIKAISLGKSEECIDYGDDCIIPGMIDIHTHGYGGGSSTDGDPDVIRRWVKYYPQEGVTTFLPGVMVRIEERIRSSLQAIADVKDENLKGAEIYGTFLQAPFLDHGYCGTYDKYLLKKPTVEHLKEYIALSRNTIKSISLAPEHDKDHEVIKYCVENDIRVCLGFTDCSYEEAVSAIEDGAINVVHCFNCMAPLLSRDPHLPGAALVNDNVYSEVMCDGIHVHPSIINLVGRMKGKDRLITVTDSSNMKGIEPGFYHTDVRDITVCEDGVGRLPNGKIAGSMKTMIENVKNLQVLGNLPLVTAINAATINPARMLGIDDTKGLIKEGYVADFAIYNKEYKIVQTYVHGEEML